MMHIFWLYLCDGFDQDGRLEDLLHKVPEAGPVSPIFIDLYRTSFT